MKLHCCVLTDCTSRISRYQERKVVRASVVFRKNNALTAGGNTGMHSAQIKFFVIVYTKNKTNVKCQIRNTDQKNNFIELSK